VHGAYFTRFVRLITGNCWKSGRFYLYSSWFLFVSHVYNSVFNTDILYTC